MGTPTTFAMRMLQRFMLTSTATSSALLAAVESRSTLSSLSLICLAKHGPPPRSSMTPSTPFVLRAPLTVLMPVLQASSLLHPPPPTLPRVGTSPLVPTLAVLPQTAVHQSPWTSRCHQPPAPAPALLRFPTTRTLSLAK